MTKPTHTHRSRGGKFALVGEEAGGGVLEGQTLVCYLDLDKDIKSVTTQDDWRQQWRPLAGDDCPTCLGTGHDHIKGRKDMQCGGCYGLGKVRPDGETPADRWQLADVAAGIIQRHQHELEQRRRAMATPAVREAIQRERENAISDSTAQQEQQWRAGRGYGPGGQRMTGD